MEEDFKRWLCKLNGYDFESDYFRMDELMIEILIKAMWQINRDGKWDIQMDRDYIDVSSRQEVLDDVFTFKDHNNSELEALTKALEYIYKETK